MTWIRDWQSWNKTGNDSFPAGSPLNITNRPGQEKEILIPKKIRLMEMRNARKTGCTALKNRKQNDRFLRLIWQERVIL